MEVSTARRTTRSRTTAGSQRRPPHRGQSPSQKVVAARRKSTAVSSGRPGLVLSRTRVVNRHDRTPIQASQPSQSRQDTIRSRAVKATSASAATVLDIAPSRAVASRIRG